MGPQWEKIGPQWEKIGPQWEKIGPQWEKMLPTTSVLVCALFVLNIQILLLLRISKSLFS